MVLEKGARTLAVNAATACIISSAREAIRLPNVLVHHQFTELCKETQERHSELNDNNNNNNNNEKTTTKKKRPEVAMPSVAGEEAARRRHALSLFTEP